MRVRRWRMERDGDEADNDVGKDADKDDCLAFGHCPTLSAHILYRMFCLTSGEITGISAYLPRNAMIIPYSIKSRPPFMIN